MFGDGAVGRTMKIHEVPDLSRVHAEYLLLTGNQTMSLFTVAVVVVILVVVALSSR